MQIKKYFQKFTDSDLTFSNITVAMQKNIAPVYVRENNAYFSENRSG